MDISISRAALYKTFSHLTTIIVGAITIFFVASQSLGSTNTALAPLNEHNRATKLITHFLDKYHYKTFRLNNTLSNEILDSYIESLDPNRSYFYKKDLDSFQIFRFVLVIFGKYDYFCIYFNIQKRLQIN